MTETKLITNKLGRRFNICCGDTFYEQRISSGPYQVRNLRCLRKLNPNPRTVLDVGMNIGSNIIEYSTFAKTVYGFEPYTPSYLMALENIKMNQALEFNNTSVGWFKQDGKYASLKMTAGIKTFNVGLGAENKIMKIINHPKNAGHNNILLDGKVVKYETFDVQIKTLDSYSFDNVDIIKIDVEGFEYNVLNGGLRTIMKHRPIVQVEIFELCCKKYGYTPQHIIDFFLKTIGNYKFLDCDCNNLGDKWVRLKGKMDYFFVPNEVIKNG